jgi:hypothetical protein
MQRIRFTKKEFDELKSNSEDNYKKFGEINCPVLKKKVIFNVKGMDHLKTKSWNHPRNEHDQWMRFKLLHHAPHVIKNSHTLQGIEQGNKFERIKVNSRWETKMMHVRYFEFISIEYDCRIRIIVKQVGESQPYFWSIVPYWKQTNDRRRKMFEGNPEED